jgi:hypothetical protein
MPCYEYPVAPGDSTPPSTPGAVSPPDSPGTIGSGSSGSPATSGTASVPTHGTVGQPVYIVLQARDASGVDLTTGGETAAGTISGANTVTLSFTDNGDGSYTASYTPANPGADSVAPTLNGIATAGAPYAITIADVVDPASCTASVPAGFQGQSRLVVVTLKDSSGRALTFDAGATVVVGPVTGANPQTPAVTNNHNGTFQATLISPNAGTDTVPITVNTTAISGSPYSSVVSASAPPPPPVTGVPPVPAGLTLFARCTCLAKPPDGVWVSGPTYGVPAGVMQQQFMEPGSNEPGLLISPPNYLAFVLQTGKLPGSGSGTINLWKDHPGTEMKEVFEVGCIRFGGLKSDGTLTNDYEQQAVGSKIFGYLGVASDPAGGNAAAVFFGTFPGLGYTAIVTSTRVAFFQQSPGPVSRGMYQNLNLGTLLYPGAATNYAAYWKLNDLGSPNGIFRMWLGTTQTHEYTNITYRTAGLPHGFWRRHWNVIWGGGGGTPKTREDRIRVDDVRLYGVPL